LKRLRRARTNFSEHSCCSLGRDWTRASSDYARPAMSLPQAVWSNCTSEQFPLWKQLGITLTKMYWLLGRKSNLSISNKLLLYKTILKPIWTYGIQFCGTASTSNTEILERFLAHDSGRTLVRAEYGYKKESPNTNS
jgi:hypothetical protein